MVQMKKLGPNIKAGRIKRSWSQDQLAKLCQLKLSNLAKLESGANHNPTLDTLICLSQAITDGSIDKLLK